MGIKGKLIGGSFQELSMRVASNQQVQMGELLIVDGQDHKQLLQVTDIIYGSQVSEINTQLIAGMALEQATEFTFYEPEIRQYTLAKLKPVLHIQHGKTHSVKELPHYFGDVFEVGKDDFHFLLSGNELFLGFMRSGSKVLEDIPIHIPVHDCLTHHMLIAATTGKGKSNLMSHMLWNLVDKEVGMLVFDPHDEYYGRTTLGLKDHHNKERVLYVTPHNTPVGQQTLRVHLEVLKPSHFKGVSNFSPPQQDCMYAYYQKYKEQWVASLLTHQQVGVHVHPETLGVVKRRLQSLLSIQVNDSMLVCEGVYSQSSGAKTIQTMIAALQQGKNVIIDTSSFAGASELLLNTIIATEVFAAYKRIQKKAELDQVAPVSMVLEEAPRVLGKDVLMSGGNVFSAIAREGRKFHVGIVAITQLPSLIPKEILANMNTKIIMGIEMATERASIIESAAQDLSKDNQNIASLDKGQAIVTSNFTRFAIPLSIPLFKETVYQQKIKEQQKGRKDPLAIPELK